MSLNRTLVEAMENVVHTFIQRTAEKYSLDAGTLLADWEGTEAPKKSDPVTKVTSDVDETRLLKCKKADLQALCKAKGLKTSGTKAQLISALQGNGSPQKSAAKPVPAKKAKGSAAKPVAKKFAASTAQTVRRNQHGNYEHASTSLIFDGGTQKVIGRQVDDGSVADLTEKDIDVCNQYKFDYDLPSNLDADARLEDEKVDELDDNSEDEVIDSEDGLDSEIDEVLLEEDLLEEDEDDLDEGEGYEYE